jgi:hypothetical protein
VIDCEVSSWGPWSECDVSCGIGISKRTRNVQQLNNFETYSCYEEISKLTNFKFFIGHKARGEWRSPMSPIEREEKLHGLKMLKETSRQNFGAQR